MLLFDGVVEGLTVDFGHHQITHNRVEVRVFAEPGKSFDAPEHRDGVVAAPQASSQGGKHHRVVVDDQDP